jgi:putative membrane protein
MILLKKWFFRLIMALVFILVLLAASENSSPVALTFLSLHSPEWPVAWWVLLAFVLGVLFGVVLNMVTNTRLKLDARKSRKAVEATRQDLDKARASASVTANTPKST